jgi:hypothetical protein
MGAKVRAFCTDLNIKRMRIIKKKRKKKNWFKGGLGLHAHSGIAMPGTAQNRIRKPPVYISP